MTKCKTLIDHFGDALKEVVTGKKENLAEAIDALLKEKEKTEQEKDLLALKLANLDRRVKNLSGKPQRGQIQEVYPSLVGQLRQIGPFGA